MYTLLILIIGIAPTVSGGTWHYVGTIETPGQYETIEECRDAALQDYKVSTSIYGSHNFKCSLRKVD